MASVSHYTHLFNGHWRPWSRGRNCQPYDLKAKHELHRYMYIWLYIHISICTNCIPIEGETSFDITLFNSLVGLVGIITIKKYPSQICNTQVNLLIFPQKTSISLYISTLCRIQLSGFLIEKVRSRQTDLKPISITKPTGQLTRRMGASPKCASVENRRLVGLCWQSAIEKKFWNLETLWKRKRTTSKCVSTKLFNRNNDIQYTCFFLRILNTLLIIW